MSIRFVTATILFAVLLAQITYATPLPPIPAFACIEVVDADTGAHLSAYQFTISEKFAPPHDFMNYSNTITINTAGPCNVSIYVAPDSYTTEISIIISKEGYTNSDIVSFNNSYYWSRFAAGETCIVSHTFQMKKIITDNGSFNGGGSSGVSGGGGGGGGAAVPSSNKTTPEKTENVTDIIKEDITKPQDEIKEEGQQIEEKDGPTGFFLANAIGSWIQSIIEMLITFFQNLF